MSGGATTPNAPLRGNAERWLAAPTFLVACFALALQYVLLIERTWNGKGPLAATVQFLSYFTILSNLLVVLACASVLFATARWLGFFRSSSVRGAVALYIGVTGAIYATILRSLWTPTGSQWLADVSLHYAVPVLYLVLWFGFARARTLRWADALRWLVLPALYLAWTLLRGAWVHEYPYPFLDAQTLGYPRVIVNSIGVTLVFVALAVLLIAYNRVVARPASAGADAPGSRH